MPEPTTSHAAADGTLLEMTDLLQSPWSGNPLKLKQIHFFNALRRAKFVLLSEIGSFETGPTAVADPEGG